MNKKQHNDFIRRAIDLAKDNVAKGGGPFGALIVKDEILVAESGNTVGVDNDPTAHAEVNAIRKAAAVLNTFDLSGCVIYSSCEPCPMCLGAVYWARIDALYFAASRFDAEKAGFSDSAIYHEMALPFEKRSIRTTQLEVSNAGDPFVFWSKLDDKTEY